MAQCTHLSVWAIQRDNRDNRKSLLGDAPVPLEVKKRIQEQVKDADDVKKRQEPYTTPVTAEALRYIVI
jgi:hypothetical protein